MSDEPATGETRAERIKRRWDETEREGITGRAGREAARRRDREAVGPLHRIGEGLARRGWRLLLTLIVLAVVALPPFVVWAFVDSDAWVAVGGVWVALCVGAAVVWMSAGTDYSGDY